MRDLDGVTEGFLGFLCASCGADHASIRMSVSSEGKELVLLEDSFDPEEDPPPPPAIRALNHEIIFPAGDFTGSGRSPRHLEKAARNGGICYGSNCVHEIYVGDIPWKLSGLDNGEWHFTGSVDGISTELGIRFHSGIGVSVLRSLDIAGRFLQLLQRLAASVSVPGYYAENGPGASFSDRLIEDESGFEHYLHGVSDKISSLREKIVKVARTSIPVLVEGENGTGKEIVCRGIHSLGPRRSRPLVIVNCMEMPASLLQSELFGHVRGSFTGAHADKKGLIESAAGGTFFLDEIGEMPLHLQATLLRVIQEKEIRRIGECSRRQVDVRFIFATNRDLRDLVERGRFRKDLYFRIKGVRLYVAPLRERREDIVLLASRFLEAASGAGGRKVNISAAAARSLVLYDWPGNVRELKNEMERIEALYPGETSVRVDMLSTAIRERERTWPDSRCGEDLTMIDAVARLEKSMLGEALKRCSGNRTRTAKMLGITRQGLLKKMKRYSVSCPPNAKTG